MATQATNNDMSLLRSMSLRHPRDTQQQPRPQISVWALVVTQATDIETDLSCRRTMNLGNVLGGSQDHIMASSHLSLPHCFEFLVPVHGPLRFAFSSISPQVRIKSKE